MADKQHLINTKRWDRYDNLKTSDHKLVMEYLKSNTRTTINGLYKIYSSVVVSGYGQDNLFYDRKNCVLRQFNVDDAKQILIDLDKSGLIRYDPVYHMVLINDFHLDVPFGNGSPDIIVKQMMKEFEEIEKNPFSKLKEFWKEYVRQNLSEIQRLEIKLQKLKLKKKSNPKTKDDIPEDLSLQPILDLNKF